MIDYVKKLLGLTEFTESNVLDDHLVGNEEERGWRITGVVDSVVLCSTDSGVCEDRISGIQYSFGEEKRSGFIPMKDRVLSLEQFNILSKSEGFTIKVEIIQKNPFEKGLTTIFFDDCKVDGLHHTAFSLD